MTPKLWNIKGELTPKGLPRPIGERGGKLMPAPWSQDNGWGVAHPGRERECEEKGKCLVCGLYVETGYVIIALDDTEGDIFPKPYYTLKDLRLFEVTDHGPMHARCTAITAAHCKTIKERLERESSVKLPYSRRRKPAK